MNEQTQQQIRNTTPEEDIRELYSRVAELNDISSALLAPEWGSEVGIIPTGHPLYVGEKRSDQEQDAPVDWQDVVKRRERELKTVGEARRRAEQQRDRLAATLDAALTSMELHWALADFHGTADEQVTPEMFKNWRAALERNRRQP
jgi:hypothetical protein